MSACDPKRTFKGAFSNRRDLPFMGPTWRIGYLPSSPHETGPIGRAIYNNRSKPPPPAASMHPPYPPGGAAPFRCPARRVEGDAQDPALMAPEGLGGGLAIEGPEPDGPVAAAREQTSSNASGRRRVAAFIEAGRRTSTADPGPEAARP